MWRHDLKGQFNIGYGGQDRRWSITRADLFRISNQLQKAKIECCDFEHMIDGSTRKDFVFADPPYRPGAKSSFMTITALISLDLRITSAFQGLFVAPTLVAYHGPSLSPLIQRY